MAVVRNTFIDLPSTPHHGPAPLASAPAQTAFSLKDSLAQAAASGDVSDGKRGRARPQPLMCSSSSMIAAPDGAPRWLATPSASASLHPVSIPPTPVATWELQTPVATPAAIHTYAAPPLQVQAVQTQPAPQVMPSRATLSLVDMIQSPQADAKSMMLQTAYHQVYQQQPLQAAALPPAVAAPAAITASTASAPTTTAYAATVATKPSSGAAAAVTLGLVQAPMQVPGPMASAMAVGSAPPQYAAPPLPSATMARPSVVMQSAPPAAIAVGSARYMVPPPPSAPAPTFVLSPTGGASMPPLPATSPRAVPKTPTGGNSPESDAQVLLALAKASGNQQAVDAALRQARQSGIKVEA